MSLAKYPPPTDFKTERNGIKLKIKNMMNKTENLKFKSLFNLFLKNLK